MDKDQQLTLEILHCCDALHNSMTGASGENYPDDSLLLYHILQDKLDTWKEKEHGPPLCCKEEYKEEACKVLVEFDNAVKALITATVTLFKHGYLEECIKHVSFKECGKEKVPKEACKCRGSGWTLNNFDVFNQCPYHYNGQRHPEDYNWDDEE